jgi:hypothetical protein
VTDPFAAPAVIPSTFPSLQSFHGRLVLISPRKIEQVPNKQVPGKMDDRITANISVVDGLGPVPVWANRVQTGQFLDGPDFTGVYISQSRVVQQLTPSIPSGMVLARVGLYKEGQPQGQGNPWGLVDPTDEDRQTARNFLANRTVAASSAPAAAPHTASPVYSPPLAPQAQTAPVYAPQPVAQQMPPQAPPTPVQLPTPGSAPAGVNPFA